MELQSSLWSPHGLVLAEASSYGGREEFLPFMVVHVIGHTNNQQ